MMAAPIVNPMPKPIPTIIQLTNEYPPSILAPLQRALSSIGLGRLGAYNASGPGDCQAPPATCAQEGSLPCQLNVTSSANSRESSPTASPWISEAAGSGPDTSTRPATGTPGKHW